MKRSTEERCVVEQEIMQTILSLQPEERNFTRISGRFGLDYRLDMRTIDAALQALRRAGKIKYNHSKRIWEVTTNLPILEDQIIR
jgi:hypothetical protein